MFAPPICRRRWRNNAFPFRQIRRRRRLPSEHRRERQRAIEYSAMREQLQKLVGRADLVRFLAAGLELAAGRKLLVAAELLPHRG
jgi:hypothetical protein